MITAGLALIDVNPTPSMPATLRPPPGFSWWPAAVVLVLTMRLLGLG